VNVIQRVVVIQNLEKSGTYVDMGVLHYFPVLENCTYNHFGLTLH
jgi:hypothetical protein